MKFRTIAISAYEKILSKDAKRRFEKIIFIAAVIGFFIHLGLIMLIEADILYIGTNLSGLKSPIDAIYTPFSIILFYEVYCLIYYLPKSITIYIGKQFEIIALITIRGIFDELASLQIMPNASETFSQPRFIYSMITILLLFAVIYVFYRLNQRGIKRENNTLGLPKNISLGTRNYIYAKKILAMCIGILFIILSLISLFHWVSDSGNIVNMVQTSKPATKDFFSSFFTILILNDALVLLFSFAITDEFLKVMRNSGFVISTTLLKLSFNVDGLVSHILVISGVVFGTAMLALYKLYDKIELPEE